MQSIITNLRLFVFYSLLPEWVKLERSLSSHRVEIVERSLQFLSHKHKVLAHKQGIYYDVYFFKVFVCLLVFACFVFKTESLYSLLLGCPRTQYVDQAEIWLPLPPKCWVKMSATTHGKSDFILLPLFISVPGS